MADPQKIVEVILEAVAAAIDAMAANEHTNDTTRLGLRAGSGLIDAVRSLIDSRGIEAARNDIMQMARNPIEPLDTTADDEEIARVLRERRAEELRRSRAPGADTEDDDENTPIR